jgi:hypothetical protein
MVQIFLAVGALELKMHNGKISKDDMFDGGRVSWLAMSSMCPDCTPVSGFGCFGHRLHFLH